MPFPLLFAWRYLFARPAIVLVNVVAAGAIAVLLLGATLSLVAARAFWVADGLAVGAYAAAAAAGIAFGIALVRRVGRGRVGLLVALVPAGASLVLAGAGLRSFGILGGGGGAGRSPTRPRWCPSRSPRGSGWPPA